MAVYGGNPPVSWSLPIKGQLRNDSVMDTMNSMPRRTVMKKFAFLLLITAVVTYGQTPAPPKPKSDAEKIASAMGAGPKFVTQNATVLDWASSPGGDFRVLRPGTNGWTCLPGFPQAAHDEPGCFDQVFLQFMKTVSPDVRPMCRVSGFHICMVAFGCLTSRMRWEATMNSTLGHTS